MNPFHLSPEVPKGPPVNSKGSTTATQDFGDEVHQPAQSSTMNPALEPCRAPNKLVLCFDGTGNKFRGDDSDSNILKIFRCLDREAGDQYHYYQPGIGTYITSNSLSHTSVGARVRSWVLKAKDSAIGSSFDQHVVGGYRFLMRFYDPGDEIYFFGFSRGAYVARFLAEMLDFVGLLSHGNEEMVAFAWKAFSEWQARQTSDSREHRDKRREMFRFMKGFRETFSRPVERIRFLGLFDTVNSVPRFEAAWMQQSKFPYTARSTAKVIRHCVSIDERRAKFRQDLIYQGVGRGHKRTESIAREKLHEMVHERYRARRQAVSGAAARDSTTRGRRESAPSLDEDTFRPYSRSKSRETRNSKEGTRYSKDVINHGGDAQPEVSQGLYQDDGEDSEDDEQDIDEIWFAGGHGDVGGGWELVPGEKPASHIPLTWMIREAGKAGLNFDPVKLVDMGVSEALQDSDDPPSTNESPDIRVDVTAPTPLASFEGGPVNDPKEDWAHFRQESSEEKNHEKSSPFHQMLHQAHVALVHDSLQFGSGLTKRQVISWKIMEYMPFRRMDLQSDGTWKPIRWPLPCGETRDIPHTARVHGSVIRRMREDKSYRPGNLIVGGGGRGMRRAPEEYGIGEWECVTGRGDPVEEVWVKKTPSPSEC
ncbi:Uu.00g103990.m01.CDS01 [Anthostomella pinea]|uniref:Uu.00g103990.m01.CDS01 n=1 Tax=Anthostomella pinea TaxID=933095 RepID=A0AAI8V8K5_9PEZI|nr:Uu.00g103990.m01.CDS01 [Anthostomella pinea]